MKKSIIIAALSLLSLAGIAQKKESKPQVQKQAVDTSIHYFYLVLPAGKWQELIKLIQSADEKPSVVKGWIGLIAGQAREIVDSSATKPKK
jgi:hypothetical protein